MKTVNQTQKSSLDRSSLPLGSYTYQELVQYLDKHWARPAVPINLDRIVALDKAFGNPSKDLKAIMFAGTNGKSITAHFTARLLQADGLIVGTFLSPHLNFYNERLAVKGESISNKLFVELGNLVTAMAEKLQIELDSLTLLTMMSMLFFQRSHVDVAIFECNRVMLHDEPCSIITPDILTITRLSEEKTLLNEDVLLNVVTQILKKASSKTHVVSADQNKHNLQVMEEETDKIGAVWHMAIRKIIPLAYPFEQLHGRCAALAKRVASIFINERNMENEVIIGGSLLAKQKARRGRPTLEAKRQLEQNPQKTLDHFWKDIINELPGRFQLLSQEKPRILLDIASNIDALKNLLLGIRLVHYQTPIKGLSLIMGLTEVSFDKIEFLKMMRYFFKKTSGQIIFCALSNNNELVLQLEELLSEFKAMKVKTRLAHGLHEALELGMINIDEHDGLIVITGSHLAVSTYLQQHCKTAK